MKRFIPILILILTLAAGCGQEGENGTSGNGSPAEVQTVPADPATPSWSPLSEGGFHPYGNLTNTFLVTRDPVAWNFLHRWITGTPPGVDIDFSTDLTLAALSSKKPNGGFAIGITDVTWSGSMAKIKVKETSPSPGQMVTMAITSPYALASLTAPPGFVLFQLENGVMVLGQERTYDLLVNEHFEDIYNPQSMPADMSLVSQLEAGICPEDGTPLAGADLYNTSLPGNSTAHYCTHGGKYWVRHLLNGPQPKWFGAFHPGVN